MPKFGTKNTLFGYFCARILKKLLPDFKSAPSNLPIFKISRKNQKCLNLGPKVPYLGIFEQKCFIFLFLGNKFKKTIVRFEINTLRVVYLQNFTKRQKWLNLGPKMPDLSIFGMEFENIIVIFEINALKFVKNESLTHAVNFSIGFTFSKSLGFTFSEDLSWSSGLLYKVCHWKMFSLLEIKI